jgi:hypothetical protein
MSITSFGVLVGVNAACRNGTIAENSIAVFDKLAFL